MANRSRLDLYGLTSPATTFALESGLSSGEWFRTEVPRSRMRELMRRSDMPAIRDTVLWLGIAAGSAAAGIVLWGTYWAIPFFLVYGVMYGSASGSRWHEAGHGTAFRTRWMDQLVFGIACFCQMRSPTESRWSHTRHHTDTLIVGRDPEIQAMRPARLARILLNFFGLVDGPLSMRQMIMHASGRLSSDEATYIPHVERPKVYRTARVWLVIHVSAVVAAVAFHSWLPVVLIGGPRFYGGFMLATYVLTQHAGLGENVLDHRLNTRTVMMNPINRFIYWNMNYHIEHHMFPMVPYHQLAALHNEIKHDTPEPYPSILAAYRELLPAIFRQLRDQTYFVKRELPPTARPYHGPVEGLLPDSPTPSLA